MSTTAHCPLRVFLSYSHDSQEYKDRVLALCDRLRSHGVDAWIDQYEISPPEGWPRWCAAQVREADIVLVLCTESYERRFRLGECEGRGLGVAWEGYVVTLELYESAGRNSKFVPIVFNSTPVGHVPDILRGANRYNVGVEEGYISLYRHLTGQPEISAPALGTLLSLLPRERKTDVFTLAQGSGDSDKGMNELSEDLEKACRKLEEIEVNNGDAIAVQEEILRLRRELREGPRLYPGDLLFKGRFRLYEVLGRGGFATVWKAYDISRKMVVAVKVLHGQHAEDRTRRERFFRGAREMAKLRHSGIVQVVEEHLYDRGYHFFVMEYVKGGDLRSAVLEGKVTPEESLPLILAVGESLVFAHQRGVIHRDVKPANILLGEDGPKLTDFDLVRASGTTGGTQTNGGWGSFVYTAPEVLDNAAEVGVVSDVYSLAMTAIFCFLGCDISSGVLRAPDSVINGLACSADLKEVLIRGIAWNPSERLNSIGHLCKALQGGEPVSLQCKPRPSTLLSSSESFLSDVALRSVCDRLILHIEGVQVSRADMCRLLINKVMAGSPGLMGTLSSEPEARRKELAQVIVRLLQGDGGTRELVANLLRPASEAVEISAPTHGFGKALGRDYRRAKRSRKALPILMLGNGLAGRQPLVSAKARRKIFDVVERSEWRWIDLAWLLLEYQPEILQITGLPSEEHVAAGGAEGLARLFSIWRGPLRCVICDSCFSRFEAELIAREVGLVIHLDSLWALAFLRAFYLALAAGRTIQESFEIAYWQVDAAGWGTATQPVLLGSHPDSSRLS